MKLRLINLNHGREHLVKQIEVDMTPDRPGCEGLIANDITVHAIGQFTDTQEFKSECHELRFSKEQVFTLHAFLSTFVNKWKNEPADV